jgi:uncharacterized cupin superfamily protein
MPTRETLRIRVQKPAPDELKRLKVDSWPIWEKEASAFPWHYDQSETCYLLEGKVKVKTDSETVEFGAGDLVIFPKGLSCTWMIQEPVRKHYQFS